MKPERIRIDCKDLVKALECCKSPEGVTCNDCPLRGYKHLLSFERRLRCISILIDHCISYIKNSIVVNKSAYYAEGGNGGEQDE